MTELRSIPSAAATPSRPALQTLLRDFDSDLFIRANFGCEPLFVRDATPQIAASVTWESINKALSLGVRYPQVRLVRSGKPVLPDRYTTLHHGQRYIVPDLCERFLAQGATMILLASELVIPGLAPLTRGLSDECHADVRADLILTLVPVAGLNVHWDQTECFNIQLAGEKQWHVFRPSRRWPLRPTPRHPERTDVSESAPPSAHPTLREIVKPGDMLYVPRGWWHLVRPVRTPSLHLSVSVDVPTVTDALLWLITKSKTEECMRQNIPIWASHDEWEAFVRSVCDTLRLERLRETICEYLDESREGRGDGGSFQLPVRLPPLEKRLRQGAHVRLRRLRTLSYTIEEGQAVCGVDGKRYLFRTLAIPALERLDRRWRSLSELSAGANEVAVQTMLETLWQDNIISVLQVGPSDNAATASANWTAEAGP